MREGISVDKLNDPLETGDEARGDAEEDPSGNVTLVRGILARRLGKHLDKIHNGHDETAQTDGSEAVRQGSPQSATRDTSGV